MAVTTKPTVSVIVPTRNRADTLPAALRSVLEQGHENLELIVIDDASTDDSEAVVSELRDPRVRYVRLGKARGAAAARNRGIDCATGRLIGFQDSDDLWVPGHLAALVEAAGSDEGAIAYGRVQTPAGDGGLVIPGPADVVRDGDLRLVLPRYNIISLPSSLIPAPAIRSIAGFDERLPRYQDWDLFLTLSRTMKFRFVEEALTLAGGGSDRITAVPEAQRTALELILRKHADLFAAVRPIRATHNAWLLWSSLGQDPGRVVARRAVRALLGDPVATVRIAVARASGKPSETNRARPGPVT